MKLGVRGGGSGLEYRSRSGKDGLSIATPKIITVVKKVNAGLSTVRGEHQESCTN